MNQRVKSLQLFLFIAGVMLLAGCSVMETTKVGHFTKPFRSAGTLNPLSSRVKLVKTRAPETCPDKNPADSPAHRVYILIHGIYGNLYTFGKLDKFLASDYPGADVYRAEYWSAVFLPSFRSLQALGEGMTRSTRRALKDLPPDSRVYIIAHSQGGLISQYALLNLTQEFPRLRFQLILLGTPGLGSDLATLAQGIVWPLDKVCLAMNVFLWPLPAMGIKPYPMSGPLVWNSQAYNMRPGSQFLRMLHQGVQWARRTGRWDNVKVSCVVGTRSLLDEIALDDSVVGFRSAAFPARGGPDRDSIYLLPYRHTSGLTKIKTRDDLTYRLLKMLTDNPEKAQTFQVPPGDLWPGKDFRGGFGLADVWFYPPNDEKQEGVDVDLRAVSLSVQSHKLPSRLGRKLSIYGRLADDYILLAPFWGIVYLFDMAASYPAEVVGRWSIRQGAFAGDRLSPPQRLSHYVLAQTDKIDGMAGNEFALRLRSTAKGSKAERTIHLTIEVTSEKPHARVIVNGQNPDAVVLRLQTNEIAALMINGDGRGNAAISAFLDDARTPLPLWSGKIE
jgi:hypothetical protein